MILREDRYITRLGAEEQLFRVEELVVSGTERWPKRFRIRIPASTTNEARTIYRDSAKEAVIQAAAYLASCHTESARVQPK